MGILHRFYARHAPAVWEVETRLLAKLGLVRPPVAVQWLATTGCNLTCPHCYTRAGERLQGELSTEEAKRLLVDGLAALGCPSLVVAGGEPLLRKDLGEVVEYAQERGIDWSIHTHGGLVARNRDLFVRCPPRMAAVSLDGPQALHDDFRGRAGSHVEALEAVRVLREAGCHEVVIGTTVTRRNADRLVEMWPVVLASGAHSWGLHLFAPEGRGGESWDLVPTGDQLRRVAAFARRKRAAFPVELDNEWGSAGRDDPVFRSQPFLCGAGRITCVVTATGDVMPCTTTDPAESQGNLRERPLSRIWAEGFRPFRERGHGVASDGLECWLQTRNGNPTRAAAFGAGARS